MIDFQKLIMGYQRFRSGNWIQQRENWEQLSKGQNPKVLLIACSDSRVDPAQIFDTNPGEIFVVRVVGALVPPFEKELGYHGVSAAIEYAVTKLEVSDILVMGHGACGGIKASLEGTGSEDEEDDFFIKSWIALLDQARDKVVAEHGHGPDTACKLEHEGVRTSLKNLRSFSFVRDREEAGKLDLHGAWFAIESGSLHLLEPNNDEFISL
ncbi:MAG: carbonic anhydrase [Zymomonas mobilis subsp. pomaceae]|uniref:Carbonic anhydrase n=1 Tax=Zymomonas mobilis subsp. pomaceae (strain ATCC 29192 / DSM 22645 / JCM 10191 / CCUG 17912 / NBRC 13757 / NCIMB 11200 / NRRL B-4491 / Barker I) TaxID=579138 RepID=F8ETQ7_ZYMMT|nr:carbonic anhydrase [Zymomonas mobilis]AEI37067.1 Carbonate dehydratase [Zymomonas mobilis subsp. pomaceae ATCC 29192]MDX5948438.1 carbonic anhydrase [Zymomonas mobilis subsp. pomaceae]GEB89498.1 carbonic anhydrase [Zymomonas mobilis subsp. pomaceae]